MLTVKAYILMWTIFKLCNAFNINKDSKDAEGKTMDLKNNFNEFIEESKNVITSLNEDIYKSNKILDKIAADSNRISRMSGFEDQQIKKIEDQLERKALDCLCNAQLIEENIFQINHNSDLEVDQTTRTRRKSASKKKKLSSKALQGLYRQVFSHISFGTQKNAQVMSSRSSSFACSVDSTNQSMPNKETCCSHLHGHSETSKTQRMSYKESSTPSLNKHSYTSTSEEVSGTTRPVSDKGTSTTHFEDHSDTSTRQTFLNKETSTASLENRLEKSTPLIDNLFFNLPQLLGGSQVVPIHKLNHSHICIDLSEVCQSNETREHIIKNSEENPDLRAKTDTPLSTENEITTTEPTTQKSFYPNVLTLLKPAPPLMVHTTTVRPPSTLTHLELVGQITCNWVCDSKNITNNSTESYNLNFHPYTLMNKKSESLLPPATDVIRTFATTTTDVASSSQPNTESIVYHSSNTNEDFSSSSHENKRNTTSSNDNSQLNFLPLGVTIPYFDLTTATQEINTTSETSATKSEIFVWPNEIPMASIVSRIYALPEQLSMKTSAVPDKSDLSVQLLRIVETPEMHPSTERDVTTGKTDITGDAHIPTSKVPFNFLVNFLFPSLTTNECDRNYSYLFNNSGNCKERNITAYIRDILNSLDNRYSNKQLSKKSSQSGIRKLKNHSNIPLSGQPKAKYTKLSIPFDLRAFFDSVADMEMSPDVVETSPTENNIRVISKNRKKTTLPCNLEKINQYFMPKDEWYRPDKETSSDECKSSVATDSMTECEIVTPEPITECVIITPDSTSEYATSVTSHSSSVSVKYTKSHKTSVPFNNYTLMTTRTTVKDKTASTSQESTKITQQTTEITKTKNTGEIHNYFTTNTETTDKHFSTSTETTDKHFSTNTGETDNHFSRNTGKTDNHFSTITGVTDNHFSTNTGETDNQFSRNTGETDNHFSRNTGKTDNHFSTITGVTDNHFSTNTGETDKHFSTITGVTDKHFSTNTGETDNHFSRNTGETGNHFSTITGVTDNHFSTNTGETLNHLSTNTGETDNHFSRNTGKTDNHFSMNTGETDNHFSRNTVSLITPVVTDGKPPGSSTMFWTETPTSVSGKEPPISPLPSKVTICIPSTCPTVAITPTISDISSTTICVPVTCPENQTSTNKKEKEMATTERYKLFTPLVDVLITIPVLMQKQSTERKSNLLRKLKYNIFVPCLRHSTATVKTQQNGFKSEMESVDNSAVSKALKSFLSKARKKQYSHALLKKRKKPLEIFIIDPNLELWRQGLKSLIHSPE